MSSIDTHGYSIVKELRYPNRDDYSFLARGGERNLRGGGVKISIPKIY